MLAVFASSAAIIWFAYGESGELSAVNEPVLVKAPSTPLKVAPDDPGGSTIAELGGIGDLLSDEPAVREERLLPRPEQPLTPGDAAGVGSTLPSPGPAPASDDAGAGLAPDAQERGRARAALEALVSEIRSGTPSSSTSGVGTPSAELSSSPEPTSNERVATRAGSGGETPLQPADSSALSSSDTTETAALDPARPVVDGDTFASSVSVGRFRVQLAAVRSEDDAKRAWALFQDELGGLVGGLTPFFERAETANGIFYRVQVGSFDESDEADALCVELKKLNASCFVVSR